MVPSWCPKWCPGTTATLLIEFLQAMAFVGSLTCTLFEIIGTLGVICGLHEFISSTGSATSGWQFLIGGILLVIIPQALTIWGEVGLLNLKDLLAKI